jgi:hypothetical protein
MLHAILVSLGSSIIGALVIVGCAFGLLKIFAPHVFLKAATRIPETVPAYKLENIFVKDLLVYSMMGSSKSQAMDEHISASLLQQALRSYKGEVSALSSLNPDIPDIVVVNQTALAAGHPGYLFGESKQSKQAKQEAPEQETANSTPEFVQ